MSGIKIFVIEGPDGVGKSTLLNKLIDYFNQHTSYQAVKVSASDEPLYKHVKEYINNNKPTLNIDTERHLMYAVLNDVKQRINEKYINTHNAKLDKSLLIFIDRWLLSTGVYQYYLPSKGTYSASIVNHPPELSSLYIDRTFVLDADDVIIDGRLRQRGIDVKDVYERQEISTMIREGYREPFKYRIGKHTQVDVGSDDVELNFKTLLSEVILELN